MPYGVLFVYSQQCCDHCAFLYPVLVTTIMILFFKSKVSLSVVTAAVMAIVGVYFYGGKDGGVINVRGLALVLVTVLTYAIYIVGVNKSCVQKWTG